MVKREIINAKRRKRKKERKKYGVHERYYIIIKQKKEGEVKVDRKGEGDGMKTMTEVSGRMQGDRSERRKQSVTRSAGGHSCIRNDVSPCTVPHKPLLKRMA